MSSSPTQSHGDEPSDSQRSAGGWHYAWYGAGAAIVGVLVAVAAVAVRPTGPAGGGGAPSETTGSPADVGGAGLAVDSPDAVDLSGTWAHKSVQTSVADIPIAGEVEATTTTLRVTEIRQKGSEVEIRSETCDSRIESAFDKIQTELPEAFIETAPVTERTGRLVLRDGHLRIDVPEVCSVRGAQVDGAKNGSLPSEPGDDRVRDGDGDGHPGVTIRVTGMIEGEMYLVQRGCDSYRGRVVSEDRIRGTVEWSTEQVLLEATSRWLSAPSARPAPAAKKNTFEMRRLDDATSCEEIASRADELF